MEKAVGSCRQRYQLMQSPKVQKYWEEGIARWGEQGDESGNVGRAWTGRALNARQGVGPHVQQMNSMLRSKYVQRNPTDTSPDGSRRDRGWESMRRLWRWSR